MKLLELKMSSMSWAGHTKAEQDKVKLQLGKVINRVVLGTGDGLIIWFKDGSHLKIIDKQDCCEERYFNTDDSEYLLQGEIFTGFEIKKCDTVKKNTDKLSVNSCISILKKIAPVLNVTTNIMDTMVDLI